MKNLLLSAALLLTVAATATAQTAAPTTDRQKARAERKAAREAAKGEKMKLKMKSTTSTATAAPTSADMAAPSEAMAGSTAPAAAAPAYAKSNKTPQERAESKSRQLIRDFGISTDQAAKIVPILVEQNTTIDGLKDKANAQGKSKEISMAMRTANEQADTKMRAVLTPEQFAAFAKAREERNAAKKAAEGK